MSLLPAKHYSWSDRLAMDIALVLEHSGDSLDEVGFLRGEVREKGMTFRLKARAQAEELLTTSWTLIHSPDVSAAVKADLIKSTVKWGGLEPRGDIATDSATGVSITINLGEPVAAGPSPKIIQHVD